MKKALLILLLFPALAFGQITLPPKVSGPAGPPLRIPADTVGAEVRWYSADPALFMFPVDLLKDTKTAVVWSNTPGIYKVIAWTAVNGVPTNAVECTVEITGVSPPPLPPVPPGPGPTPPAPVKVASVWVIVVEDPTKRTVETASVLGDLAQWNRLKAAGHSWHIYDVKKPDAAKYADAVSHAGSLPAVVLLDKATMKVIDSLPLPKSWDELNAAIKRVTP